MLARKGKQDSRKASFMNISRCNSVWLECLLWEQDAAGSSPVTSTKTDKSEPFGFGLVLLRVSLDQKNALLYKWQCVFCFSSLWELFWFSGGAGNAMLSIFCLLPKREASADRCWSFLVLSICRVRVYPFPHVFAILPRSEYRCIPPRRCC